MAKVQLKIEVNPNAETEKLGDITNKVDGTGTNANLSNVSIKANDRGLYKVGEMNSKGRELLSFGEDGNLVFTQSGYLSSNGKDVGMLASEQNPDMFVWGVVPSNKTYNVKLTFTNAQNLKDIVVYGDSVANQFPTEAIIDNDKVIYNDDYRWAINLLTESDTHTIEFTKWNRGDYNACLTLIRVMLRYFDISKDSGLIEVESLSQSNSQPKDIYYGIIPNTGSARVNDIGGEIKDLIDEGIITNSKNNIEIFIDNQKVQHHIITDSDYEDGKVFTMEFENSLSFLETKYAGRNLTDPMSAYDLLSEVLGTLNFRKIQIDSMIDKEIVYGNNEIGTVKSYLEKITIEYPYLESATYRETLDKFCVLAQLNLLEDDNGNLKFVSARPVETKNTEVIVIPVNRQFSTPRKDEFLNNKYTNPFVQYCKFTGEENTFGDTVSLSYLEDNGDITDSYFTVVDKSTLDTQITRYYLTANDPNKNALADSTLVWSKFKTSVALKIPKETIIKNLRGAKLSINGSKAGTRTLFYTSFEDKSKPFTYLPYKTTSFNGLITLNNGNSLLKGISLSNISISKEQIKFDIIFERVPTNMISSFMNGFDINFFLSGTLQLYGKVYQYELINNDQDNDLLISGNELIQEGTLYNGKKISELNQTNIIVDYTKGVRTGNITVSCSDYYDTNGNKVVDWSKQEILKVGQVIRLDKDNFGNSKWNYLNGNPNLWKITGRNFRYKGVPMLDLELQEVKLNTYFMISEKLPQYVTATYTRVSSEYGGSIGQITKSEILYPNDVIKIDYSMESNEIYDLGNAYINGELFVSGTTITVNDNLNFIVETDVKTFTISEDVGTGATLKLNRIESPYGNASLGNVTDNVFYYGDVIEITYDLESGYEGSMRLNDKVIFDNHQLTITSNNTIKITTQYVSENVVFEGEKSYVFEDFTTSQLLVDLPVTIRTGVRTMIDIEFEFVESTTPNKFVGGTYENQLPMEINAREFGQYSGYAKIQIENENQILITRTTLSQGAEVMLNRLTIKKITQTY